MKQFSSCSLFLTLACLLVLFFVVSCSGQGNCDTCPCTIKGNPSDPSWMKKAKDQIQIDEGTRRYIYLDTVGVKTVGIGHKVLGSDPEFQNKVLGKDKFSCQVIVKYFEKDFATAVTDAQVVINRSGANFSSIPDKVKEIVVNMAYQLGRSNLLKFKKMLAAISNRNYKTAADEMVDSRWYRQSGNRSKRLVAKMRSV